ANHLDWENGLGAFTWPLDEHLQPDMFVGNMAVQIINQRNATNPLFLEIGFPGPHPPYDPPKRHLDLYNDVDIPVPEVTDEELANQPPHHALQRQWCLEGNHDAVNWQLKPSKEQLLRLRRHYAANVTTIDEQVGNIINALEQKDLLDNSVIVFMSDHGDCTGDHGHIQKWTMYDAITRVPAIVWSPGRLPEGKQTDALIQHMDLAPMLFELAELDVPDHTGAESALPVANDQSNGRDAVFCELNGRGDYLVMVRTHKWKLVSYLENGNIGELYDLNADPDELHNLWDKPEHTEIRQTLLNRIRIWHTAQSIKE
ncbi:MAG: sulfatase-like hydrolase/transferase, partial [Candidatus Latescibacteria bacterium]|nr:sulfatase-like hydrolase/transferase [Candidatus Latescibacterota bacterium]